MKHQVTRAHAVLAGFKSRAEMQPTSYNICEVSRRT